MAVLRSRFLFWLLKAYVKKWGKQFILFFIIGFIIFLLLIRFSPFIISQIPTQNRRIVGVSGVYSTSEIPSFIVSKVSDGLTKLTPDGKVLPNLATSWKIENNGKKYTFFLSKNINYTDGTKFTSKTIPYTFKDVSIERPDDYTITFSLKDAYAPFLVTVSKPIFYKGYIGTGKFILNNIELNGNFIKSIQLVSSNNKFQSEEYIFYPTEESLKIAFALGEVTDAVGINDPKLLKSNIELYSGIITEKKPDFTTLITLFFNTEDPVLSDKKWRSGLTYALPSEFKNGVRVYTPYPPNSFYFNDTFMDKSQDITHAKVLIESAMETASSEAPLLKMKVLKKYTTTAKEIVEQWRKVGIKADIEEVSTIPDSFQIYLGDFNVPRDPDQYSLWHSNQVNNITRFKNLRIDKLLEDGRRNVDLTDRLQIYTDFQKYLIDESPAAFLYFPITYTFKRN